MKPVFRRLSDLCDPRITFIDPQSKPEEEFWYIDISAVDNRIKRITSANKVIGKLASVRAKQLVKTDDVLVATTRPNLNAVALVPKEYHGQVCSTGFCVLRHGPEIDPDYLFLYVQSEAFIRPLSDLVQGALYPAVTDKQVLARPIPWLPLDDQHRIAACLKAHLAEVEIVRRAAETQRSEITKLGNSIIHETLGHGHTKPALLGDVLTEIKKGIGKTWNQYPVLGATKDGLAPAKEPVGKKPERYKPAFHGTVFYNPMRILIGSIAFVDDDDEIGVTSPDYVVLTGREGTVDSRWFYYWLRSPYGEQCVSSLARGAVRERMLFNRLAEGTINLPYYEDQRRASEALKELKGLKLSIEKQLKEIDIMPSRLLSQAFRQ